MAYAGCLPAMDWLTGDSMILWLESVQHHGNYETTLALCGIMTHGNWFNYVSMYMHKYITKFPNLKSMQWWNNCQSGDLIETQFGVQW